MSKPLLLLDIDGVVLPCPDLSAAELAAGGPVEWRSPLPAEMPARVQRLASMFEIVWCTLWEAKANQELAPLLGIDPCETTLRFPATTAGDWESETFKLASVRHYAAEHAGRPIVWVDDDLFLDAFEWAAQRSAAGTLTRVVRTDPESGLDERAFGVLARFASACG